MTEDLKYVEDPPVAELQKKRYVTFANTTLSQILMSEKSGPFLDRHPSLKKKKK